MGAIAAIGYFGYMFDYPADWKVAEIRDGDRLAKVAVYSPGYQKIDYENGGTDTLKGEVITFSPPASYTGDMTDQFEGTEKVLLDKGKIVLQGGTVGNFGKTVQYSYADEQPETYFVRLPFRGQSYIQTSLQSEGDETDETYWNPFYEIAGSVR